MKNKLLVISFMFLLIVFNGCVQKSNNSYSEFDKPYSNEYEEVKPKSLNIPYIERKRY